MIEQILNLLETKALKELRELVEEINAIDLAPVFEELEPNEQVLLFRLLPKELAAETFVELDGEMQESLILKFSDKELKAVVDELYLDDAVDIIEEMPAGIVKKILRGADAETRKAINELLKYPKDSAGSIMTPEYIDLKKHMTVHEAFERIRKVGIDKETIYTCYVTDARRHLEGVVSIR